MESEVVFSDPRHLMKVFEALSSRAKIRILRVVARRGCATAKEVAEELGLKIPTVLEHLRDLVEAGVLVVEEVAKGGRKTKVYRLKAKRIHLLVDVDALIEFEEGVLEELLERYLAMRRYGHRVKLNPTVYEVRRLLGIDEELAKEFVSYLRTRIDAVIETLVREVLESGLREFTISQLVEVLRVDHGTAAMVATRMIEKGIAVAERGRIRVVGCS